MQIAVIGHGRSPEGNGWGSRIDGCHCVVRMWNWHWQNKPDYGSRYDWGLIEAHRKALPQWREHNQHHPSEGWLGSVLLCDQEFAAKFPDNTQIIDQTAFFQALPRKRWGVGETWNWQLTRGGVGACWAISKAKPGDEIILVGFDVIKAGIAPSVEDAFSAEYMASAGYYGIGSFAPGKTKEGNHDYPAERRLIMTMAKHAGVAVSFAEDVWPAVKKTSKRQNETKGNGLMEFKYVGPESGAVKCWGIEFKPGEAVEVPEPFIAKARANRFFEEVQNDPVPAQKTDPEWDYDPFEGMSREALISTATERGVKIDRRWTDDKIAAAIAKGAENG